MVASLRRWAGSAGNGRGAGEGDAHGEWSPRGARRVVGSRAGGGVRPGEREMVLLAHAAAAW